MPIHLVYFEDVKGELQLPPTSDTPTPRGFIRREANYLNEVRDLEHRLQQQEDSKHLLNLERDYNMREEAHARIRSSLLTKIASSSTSNEMKEFYRLWLMLRQEKREKWYATIRAREIYLEGLHFDRPQTLDEVLKDGD